LDIQAEFLIWELVPEEGQEDPAGAGVAFAQAGGLVWHLNPSGLWRSSWQPKSSLIKDLPKRSKTFD